jgi:hypothetical protein
VIGALLGVGLGAGVVAASSSGGGCGRSDESPPGQAAEGAGRSERPRSAPHTSSAPSASAQQVAAHASNEPPDAGAPDAAWEGPWLGAMAQITPVYPTTRFSDERLGYLRRGGKAPLVAGAAVKTPSCREGWYQLVDGGYVCGRYATADLDDPKVKLGITPPNLDALLPYRYAYNNAHGTPLYRTAPTREEMLRYEPYLLEKRAPKTDTKEGEADPAMAQADQPSPGAPPATRSGDVPAAVAPPAKTHEPTSLPADSTALDGSAEPGEEAPDPDQPWWQKADGGAVQVKLSDLEEGHGTLSRRMVKGFFIAIDHTFGSNNRLWYKTTAGLLAPADRMIIPKAPELQGMAMSDGVKQVAFVTSPKAHKYAFDAPDKKPKTSGSLKRFTAVALTGETRLLDKQRYLETTEGWWMRDADGTFTEPGAPPADLGSDEKWIDVNLSHKTLVAFEGSKPVYAALIAPGKRSEEKKRDFRTLTGTFRVREKHVATTMDGDGPVAGDLPYRIEDVPYVQYYDGSYALHGAFWHNNFGREQSHGCINLGPTDAKWLFFWTEPSLPRGWHGVWASGRHKGTLVVIHE